MSRTPIYAHHRKSTNSAACYLDLRYCFYAHEYTLSKLNLLASTTVLQFPQQNVQILHCCRSYDVVWLLPAQTRKFPKDSIPAAPLVQLFLLVLVKPSNGQHSPSHRLKLDFF